MWHTLASGTRLPVLLAAALPWFSAGCSGSAAKDPPRTEPEGVWPVRDDTLCGRRPGGDFYGTHVLRFETPDRSVAVQLQRAYVGPAPGFSQTYRLDGLALVLDGAVHCFDDPETLSYTNTHHNWTDVASAERDGVRYQLDMRVAGVNDEPMTFEVLGGDGGVIREKTAVIPTGSPPCLGCFPVLITEVMVSNTSTLADETGEHEPWIELYNPSTLSGRHEEVDLTGWMLSDDFSNRGQFVFPAVTIGRDETLVVFLDGEPHEGALHTSFRMRAGAGQIVLTQPDGVTDGGFPLDALPAGTSVEYSYVESAYVRQDTPTPGSPPADIPE